MTRTHKTKILVLLFVLLLLGVCGLLLWRRSEGTAQPDIALGYLIYTADNIRAVDVRLDHEEYGSLLDELYRTLQESDHYVAVEDYPKREGDGPESLRFYDPDGNLLEKYNLKYGKLCVSVDRLLYKLYQPENGPLDLTELYAAVAAEQAAAVTP